MKTGPNRRIVSSGVFPLPDHPTQLPLGKFRQVDFSLRREAERDLLDVYDWYKSYLESEQWAPDHATIEAKVKSLLSAIEATQASIASFSLDDGDSRSRFGFNAAISSLLWEKGLDRGNLETLIADLSLPLDMLRTYMKVIQTALSESLDNGELQVASTKAIRTEYIQRLHKVLVHHGLSDGFGRNSLIVQLILRLDGTESSDAELDARRRKDTATAVKLAVKSQEGD